MPCIYCQREINNPGSLAAHEKCCKENPNRVKFVRSSQAGRKKGCVAWNKGLTKETDKRVLNNSLSLTGRTRKPISEEQKRYLSCLAKEQGFGGYTRRGGRSKKGWYKGYWCDSSWELAWIIYQIDKGIKFLKNSKKFEYIYEEKTRKYIPDFVLDDGTYIEIKGFSTPQWKSKLAQFPHPITVLYEKDMKKILDYVKNKYGKNFIDLYEKGK